MRPFLLILILLAFVSCNSKKEKQTNETQVKKYHFHNGFAEGTTFSISYESVEDYNNDIDSVIASFEKILSTYDSLSLISAYNNNQRWMVNNKIFMNFFEKSKEIHDLTEGAFDITIAPLVNAWGFGFRNKDTISEHLIDSLLQYIGFEKLRIRNDSLIKSNPHVMMDGNAIAKGFSVDIVGNFLESHGIINYMVEIGGEVVAKGVNKDNNTWRIGIDKPIEDQGAAQREIQAIVALKDKALATSGNYRKFYYKNGLKYSHTIDPTTGRPVTHNLLSATVLTKDCMTADALATSFMVMGLEKTKKFIENHKEIGVYLIYFEDGDNKVWINDIMNKTLLEE